MRRGRWLVWSLGACALVCVSALLLLPAGAPLAADAGGQSAAAGAQEAQAPGASFGGAVPNDKFIQSFQQQVSQQLQSALIQSSEEQERRLRAYEDEQKELRTQIESLEQAVQAGTAPARAVPADPNASESNDIEAPRVNVRRAPVADASANAGSSGPATDMPGLLPSLLGGLAGSDDAAGRLDAQRGGAAGEYGSTPAVGSPSGHSADHNISPHGFVEGRLLNGVVAVVGGPERESIVALNGEYQSANGFLVDLDGCFALVQGKPEIAAGRIDFKLSRLTCNFPDGASRTWDAAGWLVDSDGIRGLRAAIVENAGRKAIVAAAGGAIGGIGQRLSQQQYQVTALTSGAGTAGASSTFVGNTGMDALGGAATGAANAIGQSINDYYNLYSPSLQVGGGTPVTVVLANDLRLPPSGREISLTHTASP